MTGMTWTGVARTSDRHPEIMRTRAATPRTRAGTSNRVRQLNGGAGIVVPGSGEPGFASGASFSLSALMGAPDRRYAEGITLQTATARGNRAGEADQRRIRWSGSSRERAGSAL